VELPPSDLGPTSSLTQTLQLLRDVLACHDASVVPIDDKKQDYKQVCVTGVEGLREERICAVMKMKCPSLRTQLSEVISSKS